MYTNSRKKQKYVMIISVTYDPFSECSMLAFKCWKLRVTALSQDIQLCTLPL